MATLEENFVTLLGTTAIAGGRVYPLIAPQGCAVPYVVYQPVAMQPQNTMTGNGTPGITNTKMQVDVYAKDYATSVSVAAAVKAAMLGWSVRNVLELQAPLYEQDVMLYRITQDYSVWHQ